LGGIGGLPRKEVKEGLPGKARFFKEGPKNYYKRKRGRGWQFVQPGSKEDHFELKNTKLRTKSLLRNYRMRLPSSTTTVNFLIKIAKVGTKKRFYLPRREDLIKAL